VKYFRILPALSLVALVLSACSNRTTTAQTSTTKSSAKREAKLYVVSAESAAFFKHGPQAGRDPDKTLSRETVVKLIRPSFGFSKVEIAETGEQGYISSEEIRPASSNLIASVSAPKPPPLTEPSTTPAPEQFNLNSDDPRLVPPPEALPPAELPAPSPEQ
jgi:hypothetical protein